MASNSIPEPPANQESNSEAEATWPSPGRTGPELVGRASPWIAAERELPRAPRRQERKAAVRRKTKEQTVQAVSQTKDRAADLYRQTWAKTSEVLKQAEWRTRRLIDEYPIQVIASVAAVAFVSGVLLRIWRSSRDA